jgi:anti-anti-sigma regulatory factor/HAMP domain-containing protein
MMAFTRLKLSTQLVILVAGTVLLTIILLVVLAIIQARSVVQDEIQERVKGLILATSDLVAAPLAAQDAPGVERIIKVMVREDALEGAVVFDSRGAVVAQTSTEAADEPELSAESDFARNVLRAGHALSKNEIDHLDVAVPINLNGQAIGVLLGETSVAAAADEIAAITPRMVGAGLGVALLAGLLALAIARYTTAPLHDLATAAILIGRGELDAPPTIQRGGELGTLASAFGQMMADLQASRGQIVEQQHTLERRVAERTADLERTLTDLRESITARDTLSATVRELSSPVVPVLDGILVMPLVGVIDTERAALLTESLLKAIEEHQADIVIMDVTGVPLVDTQVARALLKAAEAARLLGTQTILVGVRPELAQTIVGLGLNLSDLVTRADLQGGVNYAMQHRPSRSGNRSQQA